MITADLCLILLPESGELALSLTKLLEVTLFDDLPPAQHNHVVEKVKQMQSVE